MRAITLTTATVLAVLPIPAGAVMTASGNELLETCRKESSMFSSGACLGFIEGVVEGMRLQASTMNEKALVCPPYGVTVGQIRDVVMKYLADHPEQRHFSGAQVTVLALAGAWRCD